jgi:hypothetical protein
MDDKDTTQNADGNSLYDVIITTLCLEFATLSVDEYSVAVGNVTSLLRPGGFLIIQVKICLKGEKKNKWSTKMMDYFYCSESPTRAINLTLHFYLCFKVFFLFP